MAARLAARRVAQETRRTAGRNRRLSGPLRRGRRPAYSPSLPDRRHPHAPADLRSEARRRRRRGARRVPRAPSRKRSGAGLAAPTQQTSAARSAADRDVGDARRRAHRALSWRLPLLRSEGRLFDLSITHQPYSAAAARKASRRRVRSTAEEKHKGDILVFLPGAAEIRRAARECQPLAASHGLLVLPLHGDLPPAEQDRAVSPASQRKVILSTNVAESSITVEGVTAVIDSGLARMASDSPWTGLPTLDVARISKASATQRAGRAARTAPGRVDPPLHARRFPTAVRDHDAPEITAARAVRALPHVCAPWASPIPSTRLGSTRRPHAAFLAPKICSSGWMQPESAPAGWPAILCIRGSRGW